LLGVFVQFAVERKVVIVRDPVRVEQEVPVVLDLLLYINTINIITCLILGECDGRRGLVVDGADLAEAVPFSSADQESEFWLQSRLCHMSHCGTDCIHVDERLSHFHKLVFQIQIII